MAARKNPGGGKGQDKIWSDALRRAVMRESESDKAKKRIEVMADKCARMAEDGDMAAIREIGDRLDGKPAQYSEISGAGGEPLKLIVETGVPARAVEAPIIDITPSNIEPGENVTPSVTHDDMVGNKTNSI